MKKNILQIAGVLVVVVAGLSVAGALTQDPVPSPTFAAFSRTVTQRYYDHAVEAEYGLQDLNTMLFTFKSFTPEVDKAGYVRTPIPPFSAEVVLNGVVYAHTVVQPGEIVVQVPVSEFNVGNGIGNNLTAKAFGVTGTQVFSVKYENFTIQ